MRSIATRALVPIAIAATALSLLGAVAQPASQPESKAGYPCVSRPSDVREIGFSIRGTVGELLVTPGQSVTAGQLLVRLDDSVQKAIVEYEYDGVYRGVFPIKVNQLREVVMEIMDAGLKYHYGIEVGSKPEM